MRGSMMTVVRRPILRASSSQTGAGFATCLEVSGRGAPIIGRATIAERRLTAGPGLTLELPLGLSPGRRLGHERVSLPAMLR